MRSLPILVLLFVTLALPALAGDGVLEINQTCAQEGRFLPGEGLVVRSLLSGGGEKAA